jgi:HD-GYP domain-containing protein (c-di-GMP phosphodiesterase class II)
MSSTSAEHSLKSLRLSEVLGALSYALDMTEGQPAGHCLRCCWIGFQVARALGASSQQLHDIYYTILLKDLGCSSNAARICQLYLVDDRSFKHDFKTVGDSLPQVLRFVLSHTGMKADLAERFRTIVHVLQHGGEIAQELIETRCQRGAQIARTMRFSENVADGIACLDEHWNGGGRPNRLRGAAIPLASRLALLAQVVDVFFVSEGKHAALREARRRAGSWFDPRLVAALEQAASSDVFWETLASPRLHEMVLALEPAQAAADCDDDYLDQIAAGFAQIVDSKSPYTYGHSERVAVFADLIAEQMGHSADERRHIKRAALLHDIGKLGVSNAILDKPGKLDDAEWVEMRSHAEKSEIILQRVPAFADLARVGGAHHERLDGKGYPRQLTEAAICPMTRVISTADVFDALTADRPYRAAMSVAEALAILRKDVGAAIDRRCFGALEAALGNAPPR